MRLRAKTLAGARFITRYWVRAFCDARDNCCHDHSAAAIGPGRDLIADLRLLAQLQKIASGDFSPEVASAPTDDKTPRQEDDRTDDERAQRLVQLMRINWEGYAKWLGVSDESHGAYRGEECGGPGASTES